MTTDRYTKAVLTIIAGALLYIGAMLSGDPAAAQSMTPVSRMPIEPSRPQPVVVVGWGTVHSDGQVFVNTVRDAAGGTRTDATLPVALQATRQQPVPVAIMQGGQPLAVSLGVTTQRPLPVAITGIKAGADWDAVRTKVDAQPLTRYPGPP
jgi:Ni,Fe-hydrogenase III small subunit